MTTEFEFTALKSVVRRSILPIAHEYSGVNVVRRMASLNG